MDKPFAITLDPGSSLANHTGSWRTSRPVYLDRLPPCNKQCPAGEDIQGWLFHAESGDYESAWRHLTKDNPFPAIMGRVCYHTCEGACNRGKLDEPVGINSVEHFLGDEALKRGWKLTPPTTESGKHVLVVGAGPSGMSAAYHLRRLGHRVTVHEAGPLLGGMMRFGIPKYRLPREVLEAEMQRVVDLGVRVELNSKVENILDTMQAGKFDAAFLAVGAHIGKRAMIPAGDAAKIIDAISLLRSMEGEDKPLLGRRVVVYGGGNTAIDVARTAKRMGAEPLIVYRRTREKMPAHDFEVEEALQEGIMVKWLSTIKQAHESSLTIEKMALDEQGLPAADRRVRDHRGRFTGPGARTGCRSRTARRRPRAAGQRWRGTGRANMMTGHPGIFAGGDMVPAERNVTVGIGHGKQAAQAYRCLVARRAARPTASATRSRQRSPNSTPGTTPMRRKPCARCWTSFVASRLSMKSRAVSTRGQRCSKPDAAFPAATASNATTATASARTMQ
jgi:NADPH-dependent glutamate synthase beta subunit-like oxidoreductase